MKTKRLAVRGVAASWLAHFCGLGVTFFVTPILIHGLGDATYGIWSIVITLSGYYGLVNLGIGTAGTKYIAESDARHDERSVRTILATSLSTYVIMAVAVVVISVLMAYWFPSFFGTGGHTETVIFWVVFLTGLKVAVQLLGATFRSAIHARKRFDLANMLGIASQVILAVCIVLIVRTGGGLVEMAIAMLCVGILTQVSTYLIARYWVRLPRASWRYFDRDVRRTLFRFGSLTVLTQFAKRMGTYSGGIIIGVFLGPAAVAYYAVAESISRKCTALGKAVNQVTMPVASQFDAQQHKTGLVELTILGPRVLLAMALFLATMLCVLGHSFISHWISPDFAARSYPVFCILSLALLVKLPSNGIHSALVGMGRVGFLGLLSVFEGTATVLLGIALVSTVGIVGMAWAILVPQLIAGGMILPLYLCKRLEYSIPRYYIRVVTPAAAAAIPGLAVALGIARLFPARGLAAVVVQMCIVATVAAVSGFLICLDSSTRVLSLRAILPKRKHRTLVAPEVQQSAGQR